MPTPLLVTSGAIPVCRYSSLPAGDRRALPSHAPDTVNVNWGDIWLRGK